MTRTVYLAVPSLTGRPDIAHQACLIREMQVLAKAGIAVTYKPLIGDSIISRTRNYFVADFLASDCDDLVMIDDDLTWEEGAVVRLLSHPCEVVGGVYPKRQDDCEYPVRRLPGAPFDMATGLMEVMLLPTGFLRMTRECLEKMIAAYPDTRYHDRHHPEVDFHALFWIVLAPGLDAPVDGLPEIWGEDFTFCKRWRDIGGKVYLDALLRFQHIGRKAWSGCYAESLNVAALIAAE